MISLADRHGQLVLGLAAGQLLDTVWAESWTYQRLSDHFDHLGVPQWLRPWFPVIKVAAVAGLLGGRRWPRLGTTTAAAMVVYYAGAAEFHVLAGDHPVVAMPAVAFGAAASGVVLTAPSPRPSE
jgi:hypothetical protein